MFLPTPRSVLSHANRKSILGVGINDADYMTSYRDPYGKRHKCPYYMVWKSMLQRCYDSALHKNHPTYQGCLVDPSWLLFSTFKAWMEQQDWQHKCLDKDLLNGKLYSPETCLFVSPLVNALLAFKKQRTNGLPLGVSLATVKNNQYFVAACSKYGKQKIIGYFKTAEEASEAYRATKLQYVQELANQETNPKVKQALLTLPYSRLFP